MAKVEIENLQKDFGGRLVVRDLNLSIEDGEFMVLVGPSGCGKSTILRMLAGLEEITAGAIAIDGRVVNDVEPARRNVAMVFQNYALYPHMTVYKNLAFPLKMRGEKRDVIDRRVRETAAILGIDEMLDRKPKTLSGGQMQRVALGRAIVREPLVFLFDEPLSNLDAKMRVEMRAEIRRLHRDLKTTVIYVTHDQEEAMTMGSRIAVLEGGVLQQAGPPMEVYHRPANRFVASFIGSPAMNFFEGAVRDGIFTAGGIRIPCPAAVEGEAVLGVRPHDIALAAGDAGGERESGPEGRPAGEVGRADGRPEDGSAVKTPPAGGAGGAAGGEPGPAAFSAVVDIVEPLGSETHLHCQAGRTPFLVSLPGHHPFSRGDTVRLACRPGKVHFFEARTGERLA